MQKTIIGIAVLIFLGFYTYSVFLADNALIKRFEVTKDGNGGYTATTQLLDGSQLIETYKVDDKGNPLSHSLASMGTEPGSELKYMKNGTFVPKHQ